MDCCTDRLPKCLANNSELMKNMRECLRNREGFRLYQMGHMAIMEDPEAVFDRKQANTYEYKYNNANTDYYVYSAFEALCLNCGFFSWTDIGTL